MNWLDFLDALETLDLTQRQFAARVDFNEQTVSRWRERGIPKWAAELLQAWLTIARQQRRLSASRPTATQR